MAKPLRLVKAERELLKGLLNGYVPGRIMGTHIADAKGHKAAQSILGKIQASEAPPVEKGNHLTVRDAIAAFQGVLGRRLIVPPNGAALEYAKIQQRLKSLGLTREQCVQMAEQAGRDWKGSIKAQSIINQAERLLHEAEEAPLPMEGRSDYETRFDDMEL